MKFMPFHHFLRVEKVLLKDLKTKGGIILPDSLDAKAAVFKVISTGPGFFDVVSGKRVPMSVHVDDYVLCDVTQIVNVSYTGTECLIIPETGVFGCVEFEGDPAAVL